MTNTIASSLANESIENRQGLRQANSFRNPAIASTLHRLIHVQSLSEVPYKYNHLVSANAIKPAWS